MTNDTPRRIYVRLGFAGHYYRPEVVERFDDDEGPTVSILEAGPPLSRSAHVADGLAERWAEERGITYEG